MNDTEKNNDNTEFTTKEVAVESKPETEFEITWWNLLKKVSADKTTWIIVFGMLVALLGYFSSELFTNKIVYDKEGIFKKIKVDRIPNAADKNEKEIEINGKFPPGYKGELFTFPSEDPVNIPLANNGFFSIKVSIPQSYHWLFAKATKDGQSLFYRFYLPSVNQQQISQVEYERGLENIELRWASRNTFWFEPSKSVDLIIQGLIFLFGSIIAALILGINPLKLGLKLGDFKNWVPITALFILAMLPIFYYVAHTESFKGSYPSEYQMRDSMDVFWIVTFSYLVYFLGWEFIFRGYFLMALKDRIGIAPAIVLQMIPFAAMHINKPPLEAMSSVFGGIVLGILVIRVRSFWPCVIIHWVLHTSINYFVCMLHYW